MVNIIITLIRGKALAILLGPAGMGLNGLFLSGLNLIKTASSLGIEQSAVRDISAAHASGNIPRINRTFSVFRRWIWITATLGVFITIALSPLLSRFSFKSGEHTWSFVLLSATFIFGALAGGIYTLLRGTRNIKAMAQANIVGSVAGLIVALPVFYFYGIKGVVPAIILTSFSGYLVSVYFRRKISFQQVALSFRETMKEGGGMVKLGISLSLSALMGTGVSYILYAFITRSGGLTDVGLYSSAMTIVGTYVGMVFSAMGTDYFPRLSGVIHDECKWKLLVNQQAEMVILILGPILAVLLATAPLLIRIILSVNFLPIIDFLTWAVLGLLLKGVVWVMGFVLIAKGDNKLFLGTETIGSIYTLGLNVLFYHFYGLKGLGISMFLSYLVSVIMMSIVLKLKYDFQFTKNFMGIVILFFILLIAALWGILQLGFPYAYFTGSLVTLLSIGFAIFGLNRRLDLLGLLGPALFNRRKP